MIPTNPWQPIDACPTCGSTNLRVGSVYDEDEDFESWECRDCGSAGGGANFWKDPRAVIG